MSGALVVLIFGIAFTVYVILARHLNSVATPPPTTPGKCQHQQTARIGMWAWECTSGCGEVFEVEPS